MMFICDVCLKKVDDCFETIEGELICLKCIRGEEFLQTGNGTVAQRLRELEEEE